MRDRVVSVFGAGNLRCAPPVLASLGAWQPDDLVTVKLFDANEERLDLFDRFLRQCMEAAETEHVVVATTDYQEALVGVTDAVLTVHEDCARRMTGQTRVQLFDPLEGDSLVEQLRGDPNRPTPPQNLSERTHELLSTPVIDGVDRDQAIQMAAALILPRLSADVRVLSLLRETSVVANRPVLNLDWPDDIADGQRPLIPHQILRWIQGESSLGQFIESARWSPMSLWLNEML